MSISFKVDDSEFQETLKKYLTVTPKELSEALNTKMFYIVRGAVRALPKVEKATIENALGLSGHELQYTKEREKKPTQKKRNLKRELRRAVKGGRKQLRSDLKQFGKGLKRFGKSASKSGSRFGKQLRRKIRKAFR